MSTKHKLTLTVPPAMLLIAKLAMLSQLVGVKQQQPSPKLVLVSEVLQESTWGLLEKYREPHKFWVTILRSIVFEVIKTQ